MRMLICKALNHLYVTEKYNIMLILTYKLINIIVLDI